MKQFTIKLNHGGRPSDPVGIAYAEQHTHDSNNMANTIQREQLHAMGVGGILKCNNVTITRLPDSESELKMQKPLTNTKVVSVFKPAQVTIDGETYFDCYVGNVKWNGFAMPQFTHEQLLKVIDYFDERGDSYIDYVNDRVYYAEKESQYDVTLTISETITVDRGDGDLPQATVWPFGAGSFAWEKHEPHETLVVKFQAKTTQYYELTRSVEVPLSADRDAFLEQYHQDIDGGDYDVDRKVSEGSWDRLGWEVKDHTIKVTTDSDRGEADANPMRYIDCTCGNHGNQGIDEPPQNIQNFELDKNDQLEVFTVTCNECGATDVLSFDNIYEGQNGTV